jgi:hypothetical protein
MRGYTMSKRTHGAAVADALATNAEAPRDGGEPVDPIAHAEASRLATFEHDCAIAGHAGPCSLDGIRDVEHGDGPVHNREREAYPAAIGDRCEALHPTLGACFRRRNHAGHHLSPSDGGRNDTGWDSNGTRGELPEPLPPTPADLTRAVEEATAEATHLRIATAAAMAILVRAIDAKARQVGAGAFVTIGGVLLRATRPRKRKGAAEDPAALWTLEAVEVAT